MITEEYVSFETAKLLKEKGFNEECFALYNSDDMLIQSGIRLNNIQVGRVKGSYSAPTLQMTMKWLREVHDIYIDISIYIITKNTVKYNINVYYKKHKNDSMYMGIHLTKECLKYEEAAEVAIKYCLENLI